ncbi:hypothetical protein GCM10020331_080200 [Ectobacillus funiculus]
MEHRLPYYLSQVEPYPEITSNPQYMKEIIVQNMKQDIDKAFLSFIQNMPHHIQKGVVKGEFYRCESRN